MQEMQKNRLVLESKQQLKALKMIGHWRTLALALSAVGVALSFAGFHGTTNLLLGIPGILLVILGFVGAAIFNLGIRNGRRNVEKILKAIEGQ